MAASTKIYDENGFRLGICTKNGEIYVKGYSFDSTLSEFIQEVKKMPDGSKFTKEYLLVIELIKTHFDIN